MPGNISALRFQLLAAVISFVVGTAAASLRFTSNGLPQQKEEPTSAVAATAKAPTLDCSRPRFHTSNTSRIVSMLYQFVESKGTARTKTFYVEEVDDEQRGGRFAQVYWKEDRSVIFISPPYDAENFEPELTYLKRIDLDRDVVPTEADVGATNYLVPRPWIQDVLKNCV